MRAGEEKTLEVVRRGYPGQIVPLNSPPPLRGHDEWPAAHLLDWLQVILARRATFITVALAVMVIGTVSLYKQIPIYQATVSIQIDPENAKILPYNDVVAPLRQSTIDDALQTEYKILESQTLARKVVADLHLDKEFSKKPARKDDIGTFVSTPLRTIREAFSNGLRSLLRPPSETVSGSAAEDQDPLRPYVDMYLGGLTVTPVVRTRLVSVSFESPDPRLASKIANAHAEHFIEQNLQFRWDATQVASDFLRKELSNMKADLERAESNLQTYAVKRQLFVVDDTKGTYPRNTETERLNELETAYTKAQTDRIEKESSARLIRGAAENSLETGPRPAESLSMQLIELQRQDAAFATRFQPGFGPRKEIQNQIQTLSRAIEADKADRIKRAEEEYATALDREQAFAKELESQHDKVNRMKQENVQYDILKREADSNRQLYDGLLLRLKEAGMQASLKASNIRIVDRAPIPTAPIRPDKRRSELYTLLLAIVLASAAVHFQEYLDSSLKRPDDVSKYLKLPTLGLIPRFEKQGAADRPAQYLSFILPKARRVKASDVPTSPTGVDLISHTAPASLLAEAYRSLRASLILSSPDRPPRTVLVTSSVPSEGKTATAVNLAISLTQSGARVLVIDADMRRPRIGTVFSMRHKAGLSNFLSGVEEIENVIHETPISGLFVIPCGVVPPNPGELLLSIRFKHMFERLSEQFNYIVIDSPPLSNVSDGRIMAAVADGVVFVVRALATSRHVVIRSLDQLEESHSRILGVVLNDYDVHHKGHYYDYPYYKQSHYKTAYASDEANDNSA